MGEVVWLQLMLGEGLGYLARLAQDSVSAYLVGEFDLVSASFDFRPALV